MAESSSVSEDVDAFCVSIPRGGPIYVPDMVGPLTRVPDFEACVYNELQDLNKELSTESFEISNNDISVDELKIITEEELVNKAFEEAFKDVEKGKVASQVSEENLNAGREEDNTIPNTEHACQENSNRSSLQITSGGKSKKRKRDVNRKDKTLDETYIAKVKELARTKQQQDEDKANTVLHSFNGSCRINHCSNTSEKTARITSLKSMSSTKVRASNASAHVPLQYPEVVLCFEIFHNKRTWVKTQEFMVLGRQFLTELRDKIYCLTDKVMKKAGQHDHSGYFLIEEVFCNDLRDPSAKDYSKPILDWLENSKNEALEKWECIISGELQQKQKSLLGCTTGSKLPQFRSVYMHKIRFCDLRLRVGAAYLYCHQGDCKHVFVLRDMRLIHPEDVQNRAAYPLVTFQIKQRIQKCDVCKIYRAEKVTVDDKWAANNPCYFCDLCYYMLHYENGSLLYNDFSVYDYHHD